MTAASDRTFSIMHVLLEPRYAGAETLVRDLVQIQSRQGHRTSIAAFRPSQDNFVGELKSLERQGCELHIPKRNLGRWGRVKWVMAAVRKARPDIVFAHSILPSVYVRLALRLTRRPAIVTVLHTDDDMADPALLRMERFLYNRNACVVGVSSRSIENYQRWTSGRTPLRVVLNGINAEHFAAPERDHRRWREQIYEPLGDEIIALQVGRISLQKQQHISVEALIELQARGLRNIRLVLAGLCEDAAYEQQILSTARAGGVSDRVLLVGPQGNIAEWLAGADIFLMPSAWEAQGIAALEALASGLFCVFSGLDPFEEFRSWPGVSTIAAPPDGRELAGCLEALVNSKGWDLRYDRDMRKFSIESCAAEYTRIIDEFAPRHSRLRVFENP
jgi:L-malate glycosyltransferase